MERAELRRRILHGVWIGALAAAALSLIALALLWPRCQGGACPSVQTLEAYRPPQAVGAGARARDRAEAAQGPDPRAVPEPDLPGQRPLRGRGGRARVLRQAGGGADRGAGGPARGPAQGADHV